MLHHSETLKLRPRESAKALNPTVVTFCSREEDIVPRQSIVANFFSRPGEEAGRFTGERVGLYLTV